MALLGSKIFLFFLFCAFCILFGMWIPNQEGYWLRKNGKTNTFSFHLKNSPHIQENYRYICLREHMEHKIEKLLENVNTLRNSSIYNCSELYKKFASLYEVELSVAPQKVGYEFSKKMKMWLGNSSMLMKLAESQRVLIVHDKLRQLTTVYNPLRSNRPTTKPQKSQKVYLKDLVKSSKAQCDFCRPLNMTAEDIFGRIYGKYSVSASNAFKLNKWHGLFIPYEHDIFEIDENIILDLFNTSIRWFKKVRSIDNTAQYPVVFWDVFPHAGASQMHVHIHGLAGSGHYPGEFKDLLHLIGVFQNTTQDHYWDILIDIHDTLGLSLRFGKVIVISPLVPRREHELWIVCEEPSQQFFQMLYIITKMYQDSFGKFCFSMAGALPTTGQRITDPLRSLPALFKIGTRGDCSSPISDVSSLELYLFNNVNTDPYQTIITLERFINSLNLDNRNSNCIFDLWDDSVC